MNEEPKYSSEQREQMRVRAQTLLDKVHKMQGELKEMSHSHFFGLLGDQLEGMLLSVNATIARFADSNPKIRQGAFSLIAHHWGPDPQSEELYKRVAVSDPNPNVRAAALSCLARLYRGSFDRNLSRQLIDIFKNPENSPSLRVTAYLELLTVQNIKPSNALNLALLRWKKDTSVVPAEIDWGLIERMN